MTQKKNISEEIKTVNYICFNLPDL